MRSVVRTLLSVAVLSVLAGFAVAWLAWTALAPAADTARLTGSAVAGAAMILPLGYYMRNDPFDEAHCVRCGSNVAGAVAFSFCLDCGADLEPVWERRAED